MLLRQSIDESEKKTTSNKKTILQVHTLQKRLASLEQEVIKFKIILLEAINQKKMRENVSIAPRTGAATKSTIEFIKSIFHIPKFLNNSSKIDGLI